MEIIKSYALFLDDYRFPEDVYRYTGDYDFVQLQWKIVRNYEAFVDCIESSYHLGEFPEVISFDHDLSGEHYLHLSGEFPYDKVIEKTGMHCALWLLDFCRDHRLVVPKYKVHSQNPIGRYNIEQLFGLIE
jgi:hypothetical protein